MLVFFKIRNEIIIAAHRNMREAQQAARGCDFGTDERTWEEREGVIREGVTNPDSVQVRINCAIAALESTFRPSLRRNSAESNYACSTREDDRVRSLGAGCELVQLNPCQFHPPLLS